MVAEYRLAFLPYTVLMLVKQILVLKQQRVLVGFH